MKGDYKVEGPPLPERSPGSRLQALFGAQRLSPAQRLIAHYLVENPREAPFLSSTELAERVGVSQPSVTRFAIALGYEGYGELKDQIRVMVLESDEDESRNSFQMAVDTEIRNLTTLKATLADPKPAIELGEALAASTPLVVTGLRASAPIAWYFSFFCAKVHPDVRTVTSPGTIGADQVAQAIQAGAEWMLVFLLPRYPRETLQLISEARDSGLRIAVVTDSAQAPVSQMADTVLTAAVGTELVFDSQAGPMLVATVLLEAMSDANPSRSQSMLQSFEGRAIEERIFVS